MRSGRLFLCFIRLAAVAFALGLASCHPATRDEPLHTKPIEQVARELDSELSAYKPIPISGGSSSTTTGALSPRSRGAVVDVRVVKTASEQFIRMRVTGEVAFDIPATRDGYRIVLER
jgi:hypothetical protein